MTDNCKNCGRVHEDGGMMHGNDIHLLGVYDREVDALVDRVLGAAFRDQGSDVDNMEIKISALNVLASRIQYRAAEFLAENRASINSEKPTPLRKASAYASIDADTKQRFRALGMASIEFGHAPFVDELYAMDQAEQSPVRH